jgi:tape measure domain-containing protein
MTESLITRFVLDDSQYRAGGASVIAVTKAIDQAVTRTQSNAQKMAYSLGHAIGSAVRRTAIGVAGLGASVVGLSIYAMKAAADMDSLKRALTAVAGSSAEAERQFASLKRLADASPVLDIESAIRGSIGLQSTGQFTADEAERIMSAISNAIALSGGNIEGFSRVMENLKQIASQGKLTGDELRETASEIPALRQAMLAVFGTTNAGDLGNIAGADVIKRLAAELAKLPQVSGGVQTAFDNLGSSVKIAFATIGDAINRAVIPVIQRLTGAVDWLANSGVLQRLTESMVRMFDWKQIGDVFLRGLSWVIAIINHMPTLGLRMGVGLKAVFQWLSESASMLAAVLGGLFLGPAIINGIMQIVRALVVLRAAIQGVGLMAVVIQSIVTGGAALTKMLAGFVAGVLAVKGLLYVLERALPKLPEIGKQMGLGDISKDAQAAYAEMQKAIGGMEGTSGGHATGSDGGASQGTTGLPTLQPLQSIESNTRRTADATQKLVERFEQTVFGGSELGRYGLTARDIGAIKRGGAGFDAQIEEAVRMIANAVLGLQSRTLKAT